jgi:hypothetical protein
LALQLVAGETLRAAAVNLSITYKTARTELKNIFNKTGTCRQAELVIVLVTAVPQTAFEQSIDRAPRRLGSKEQISGVIEQIPGRGSERLSGIGRMMWERQKCVSSNISPTSRAKRPMFDPLC